MRHSKALLVLCTISTVLAVACNRKGGGITGPSGTPDAQPVSVLSGRTGQPVPSLTGTAARIGQALHLQAPGFFALHTAYTGGPVLLWPADDGFLSAHHTRSLVYAGKDPGTLTRLPRGVTTVSLVPDAGIRAFPWALTRVRTAANTLSESHPTLDFAVDGGGFTVDLVVNVADEAFVRMPGAAAAAYVSSGDDGVITKAKVVFRTLQIQGFWYTEDNFETSVVHEVIHTTGLDHSQQEDPPGIMSANADSYGFHAPTEYERLIMKMQYERLPGTTLAGMAESDPGVSAKASEPKWHLVCIR